VYKAYAYYDKIEQAYWTRNVIIIFHRPVHLSLKSYYPFFTALPRRPAGIIDGTTLPPAGLDVSFLPSTGFDIGAAARDPLFIFTPPLLKLRR
jgi:hypothetical protein